MAQIARPGIDIPNSTSQRSLHWLATTLLLVVIVLVGAYFRFLNITNWDGGTGHHPDERFMHYTVVNLSVPDDWLTYFATTCPSPMPVPRNPQAPPEQWEPSANSGCSTLNPRNFVSWSGGYVYGTLPTTLTRVVVEATERTDLHELLVTARALSAGADLVVLLALFFLTQMLYGRRVGLLAAALYAGAVMPIQQAHFFTVDTFAVAFGTLALLFITRLARRANWFDCVMSGIWIGAAVASKINMAALVGLVFVALCQVLWSKIANHRRLHAAGAAEQPIGTRPWIVSTLIRIVFLLTLTGLFTFGAFRVFQPDAFTGPNIWNIALEPRFRERLNEARVTASGDVDIPPGHQWAARTPWLFPWQNMVLWGMGAPLGLAAWLAWGAAGWLMLRRRLHQLDQAPLVPWMWIGLYFAWQGQQFVTSMRYFLPIYPPLIMFAAWGLVALWERTTTRARLAKAGAEQPRVAAGSRILRPSALLLIGVLAATWIWAWGYTRIYTRPYTRIAAAEWLEREAPGATTTWELWDDPLPGASVEQITTYPYAEEEPNKYTGNAIALPGDAAAQGLLTQLAQADYVVLTSPRVYASIARIPQRFPATLRYYEALFDGSLGFELATQIRSRPSFLGLPINDQTAEEAFFVYDHPPVLIFRRSEGFSIERARQAIIDGMVWDEVYRGLRPAQINDAPTALQLTARAWDRLQSFDARYLFNGPTNWPLALVIWLLGIEVLGLAAAGILWRLHLPLADRGLSLARMMGLLCLAAPLALLATTTRISVGRSWLLGWGGLLLVLGTGLLWHDRRSFAAFGQRHRSAFIVPQLLYVVVLVIGAAVLVQSPAPPPDTVARWTALVRSPTLPPYDPAFAGGLDPLPYTARLPFARLEALLGLTPSVALRLALPTALALAVLGVWSALYNIRPAFSRAGQQRNALWASGGAMLLVVPGLLFGSITQMSGLYALSSGNLDVLGLAALTATTLGLGVMLLRRHNDLQWSAIAAISLPLMFVRGHGLIPLLAVWLVLGALALAGQRGNAYRWSLLCGPILVAAIGLGQPLSWSVVAPTLQAAPFQIEPLALVAGLLIPLGLLAAWSAISGPRLADRGTLLVVTGVILGWTVLVVVLRWSLALLAVPPLMAMIWLAVQAWLPGWGPRRWRAGVIPATAAIALTVLVVATLALLGRVPGDAYQLFMVATVLLVCAAGWSFPLLRRTARRAAGIPWMPLTLQLGAAALTLVCIAATYGAIIRDARTRAEKVETDATPALVDAGRWLAANSTGSPVIVTAPQQLPSAVTSESGLPTLLTTPDAERRLRDVVQPAVNGVIDGRIRAIDALYGGNVATVQETLQKYQLGYVLVGPAERAAYGDNAGGALEVLAQRGTLMVAYDQNGIQLYAASPSTDTPQYVTQTPRLTLPTKSALLEQPVDELPVVDEYGWNRLATRYPALGVGLWLLVLEVLGLLAFPLTSRIFRRWHDHGWSMSKLVGLLIWGYAVWLPVNLGWWLFNWWSLAFGGIILALIGMVLLRHNAQVTPETDRAISLFPPARQLFGSEVLFLAAFGAWTLVRAANPDVWHPYYGGEKPFEFGFLNAILRSPVLPPYDPFFSDGIINYYYYGLFLVALPIKAIGIDPAIGFNLALVTLFALTFSATFALGRALTGRKRYGFVATLLMLGLGPLASVVPLSEKQGLGPVVDALQLGFAGFGERLGDWFWGPSRVIPNTINEFPLFGFLFADLHPHLIALPVTLLAIACAAELIHRHASRATIVLGALVLGTLAVANSWDAPTYALVMGGALIGRAWRSIDRAQLGAGVLRVLQAGLLAASMVAAGLVLYAPFFLHYRAMVGGIGLVRRGDTLLQYLLVYGPLLFLAVTLLVSVAWKLARGAEAGWRIIVRGGAIALPLLVVVLLLSGGALQQQPDLPSGWPLRIVLGLLSLLGLTLAFHPSTTRRLRDQEWLVLWLVTVGVMVGVGMQVVFVRDHLAGGDWERMNTVFKFGIQLWALWAIGGATAIAFIFKQMRRNEIATGIWLGLLIMLVLPGLVYPAAAIPSRLATRFDRTTPLTLDGLAFMSQAQYSISVGERRDGGTEQVVKNIDLGPDAEAIAWLKQHIAGTPIVATSEAEFYRTYGVRVAANTGLPTILGRLHEDEQREPRLVYERERDVQELFNTPDPTTAARLLAKYHVTYVYIGLIERAVYDPAGIAKFTAMHGPVLDLMYENEGVRIYRVKAETLANVVVVEQAPMVTEDELVTALQARVASNPGDNAAAFGLGQRLIEVNRGEEAAAVLATAADAHPDDVPLHHLLGDVLAQLGRADEAIAAWQHAADVEPTGSNLNKLGTGLVRLGRWDEAETVLRQALAADPTIADPYFYLGELYRSRNASGDRERARDAYQRYLDAAPVDGPWRTLAETHISELGR